MRLSRLIVPVILSVRKELNLPIDASTYVQIMEDVIRKQETGFTEFLQLATGFVDARPPVAPDAQTAARR